MTHGHGEDHFRDLDSAPGDEREEFELAAGVRGYLLGLFLATLLTAISFALPWTNIIWKPGIPVALVVFAIAQMGVHLVFFLHITTSPDNTNNILALAFGVLIVFLIIGGSIWIMNNLNRNMLPGGEQTQMQMGH
ncbi:cytochrome o ubiquinol oxidase subunit IV [Alsobacter soli]|uniref:Cytochrome bo(3) ubiquinol oxidase subunit 4 n=1 Tax=Alsobacter soli TaxID=2109933 RepID=A0A2T1HWW5_9HYPH|nr:cytochrome o ubiquinol oxidase subunit IV [Alsobacter soli]PSC06161.1 cytochrome o ubiquinol oxidase subunit IV [Alsobacter soli]